MLVSTSGVLGRAVTLWPPVTIGIRALLAIGVLYAFLKFKKISLKVEKKDRGVVVIGGILMGVHWVTYFMALQLSTVAIGMLTIYTYPAMSSVLEPLILKTKFQKMHLFLGAIVLVGLYFLVPEFSLEHSYTQGILFGLVSALAYALRNILMKNQVEKYHGSLLMWYQMVVIGICLLPVSFTVSMNGLAEFWPQIVALAVLTTAIGHTMFLMSLKHFNVTTAALMSSVQPIYGIIMGFIFLGETPRLMTLFGGSLILCTVIFESVRSARNRKKELKLAEE